MNEVEPLEEETEEEVPTGVPCDVFSRIVGYLSPVQGWHVGKQQEFKDRKEFRIPDETITGTS